MQPGDEVHPRQDRQGWEAGGQEEEEGGGGGGQEEVGKCQQALLTPVPAQREPQDGDPEEAGSSWQGAAAGGPGMRAGKTGRLKRHENLCPFEYYPVYTFSKQDSTLRLQNDLKNA